MKLSEKQLALLSAALIGLVVVAALLSAQLAPAPEVAAPSGYVALVKLEGAIAYETSQLSLFGSTVDAEDLIELLDRALKDPGAKAVVLCIDSPGGSAAASEALYLKVLELASSKPVVAYIRGLGTSGAYMAALPAKAIVAAPSSMVGSVGVYLSVVTFTDLLEKLGVRVYVFKSGELKDIGAPYREPTREEMEVLEQMVSDIFQLFKERVLKHRSVTDPEAVFSGRPFTAAEALKLGLVDKVGTLEDAVSLARELAGLPEDAPVRELEPPKPSLLQLLLGGAAGRVRPLVPAYEVLAMWPPPTANPPVARG